MSNAHDEAHATEERGQEDKRDPSGLAGPDGQEPVDQTLNQRVSGDQSGQDAIATADVTARRPEATQKLELAELKRQALQAALPRWLAEKMHWNTTQSGFNRLSPNEDFLNAVFVDAPKFKDFGDEKLDKGVLKLVDAFTGEASAIITSATALDGGEGGQERAQTIRHFKDRAARNLVYAAINQFEMDQWVANSAKRGQDAMQHDNFGEKQSRRDTFALKGAFYARVLIGLGLSDAVLVDGDIVKSAKGIIYQQCEIEQRKALSPSQEAEQQGANVDAAVATARPFE